MTHIAHPQQLLHEAASTEYAGLALLTRRTGMPEIFFSKALNKYDDYAAVNVYHYSDGGQKFFFDCEFVENVPPVVRDSVIVEEPKYSILVSRIGKTTARSSVMKAVENAEQCKAAISDYFRTHPMGTAKTPPQRVIFA